MAFLITENDIGSGLKIDGTAGVAGTLLKADIGAGLVFNGNLIELAALPVTLSNPTDANLQADVNGNMSNVLDLTPAVKFAETKTTITYAPATKILTYTGEDGIPANIDLSALAMDIFVNGGTYNAATMVLTLTDNDGTTPDIMIALSELKTITTAASDTITFSGDGSDANPLTADLVVDPLAGNLLKTSAAGAKVDPADVIALATYDAQSLQGVHLFYAFP